MDRIDFNAASLLSPVLASAQSQRGQKQEAKKTRETPKGSAQAFFSDILDNFIPSKAELGAVKEFTPSQEALTELMDAVHSSGSDLLDRPFHEEILRYKKAVRNFVNYVVENAFALEKTQARHKGRTKIYTQVQVIDRKLEELAAAILSGQTSQLTRVSKVDEIKGLLVDLTLSGVIRERDE